MAEQKQEMFSSRWALILSALGMAVGTGNIWRFPRILAKTGGGAFLIPWILSLFLWSIPLLVIELAAGRASRSGPLGAVGSLIGKKYAWMGGFVALCATMIMFYYSVVTGWCFKYFFESLTGGLSSIATAEAGLQYFTSFTTSYSPILFHAIAIFIASIIVYRGVSGGIEKANKILLPSLLVMLIISMVRALSLPGAEKGLAFIFTPHWETLLDYRTWLEALTQSAWSTGAGWGLLLVYASYMRKRNGMTLNALVIGFGNNSASLIAAMVVIPTAFALIPATMPGMSELPAAAQYEQTIQVLQASGEYSRYNPASTGTSFVYIPALYHATGDQFGGMFMALFFLALSFAATTSLISMVELASRVLIDAGIPRKRAIMLIFAAGFLFGVPSAWNMDFFSNQDWVWGVGLMVSGFLLMSSVMIYGVDRFRTTLATGIGSKPVGRWFNVAVMVFLPLQFFVLITWWFSQVAGPDWWNPFAVANPGTCLFQWAVAILFLIAVNKPLAERSVRPLAPDSDEPDAAVQAG